MNKSSLQVNGTTQNTTCWIICEVSDKKKREKRENLLKKKVVDPRDWRRLFFPWIGMFLLPTMLILWTFVFNCGKV